MKTSLVKQRYELIVYENRQFSKDVITKEEFLTMQRDAFDHVLAVDLGLWCFRTRDGRWIENDLSEVSIGDTSLKVLECIQCEPGEFSSPNDVAEITGIDSMREPNNLSARLSSLRLKHNESAEQQNFFLSKRTGGFGICWNPDRSFMVLTRIHKEN